MMLLVLVAVVAVQFVLAERERRELGNRLEQMSGELNRSTAVFVKRAHEIASSELPPDIGDLLTGLAPDSALTVLGKGATVRVVVFSDSIRGAQHAARLGSRPSELSLQVLEEAVVQGDSGRVFRSLQRSGTKQLVWMRSGLHAAQESICVDTIGGTEHRFERRVWRAGPGGAVASRQDPGRDFVINLPVPHGVFADSLYSVQVRYSYASIAEQLASSRRRSLVWLATLLGLSIVAAIGVAGQFTRPIRALEASFGRVVQGDLDVQVAPERSDEIGHLTASFNHMVARLRDSQRMADRLVASEHLASLGRLAAGIAHEIRNPLNAILLNLQQMQDRVRNTAGAATGRGASLDEFDKYHARITGEIARLERMVGSFLDLARSGEVRLDRVDVAAGLRAAVELYRPLAVERGLHLEVDVPERLEMQADPARLPMVWNNLLANAIEATPRGGRVTLRARLVLGASEAAPSVARDLIEVEVEDTGPGIPPEARRRIWEPFYSGREAGTGLGLTVVLATVEHHGGTIDVDCPPAGGTRMRVRLPRSGAVPGRPDGNAERARVSSPEVT
jgi:signal transduction histidine kinase